MDLIDPVFASIAEQYLTGKCNMTDLCEAVYAMQQLKKLGIEHLKLLGIDEDSQFAEQMMNPRNKN